MDTRAGAPPAWPAVPQDPVLQGKRVPSMVNLPQPAVTFLSLQDTAGHVEVEKGIVGTRGKVAVVVVVVVVV